MGSEEETVTPTVFYFKIRNCKVILKLFTKKWVCTKSSPTQTNLPIHSKQIGTHFSDKWQFGITPNEIEVNLCIVCVKTLISVEQSL